MGVHRLAALLPALAGLGCGVFNLALAVCSQNSSRASAGPSTAESSCLAPGVSVMKTCAFSIFVRVEIAGLFRPAFHVHPQMIHPTSS